MSDTSTGRSGTSVTLIWAMVLPISRWRAAPAVPVTTISSKPSASSVRVKSYTKVSPAATVFCAVAEPRPDALGADLIGARRHVEQDVASVTASQGSNADVGEEHLDLAESRVGTLLGDLAGHAPRLLRHRGKRRDQPPGHKQHGWQRDLTPTWRPGGGHVASITIHHLDDGVNRSFAAATGRSMEEGKRNNLREAVEEEAGPHNLAQAIEILPRVPLREQLEVRRSAFIEGLLQQPSHPCGSRLRVASKLRGISRRASRGPVPIARCFGRKRTSLPLSRQEKKRTPYSQPPKPTGCESGEETVLETQPALS